MNANKGWTSKARAWAANGIVWAAVAVFGSSLTPVRAADRAVPSSENESLAAILQNAPAVARAIEDDKDLRSVVGADKWALALHRLAEFSKRTDADHKDALRIIGDTVTRAKSPVGTIKLDGDPSDWSESMPGAEFVRPGSSWTRGVAAVVRQDRLYLMAGIEDAAQYFAQPGNELRVTIDCQSDQPWDVGLSISMDKGTWIVKQKQVGFKGPKIKALPTPRVSVATVAEIAIDIRDFVPLAEAKPIWTLYLETIDTGRTGTPRDQWDKKKELSVFNENAMEGVAAWPYVRTFLCLCADQPLEEFELTAAAIAIMSSSMYARGDEDVRKRIPVDNAEFLEFARSIDKWQEENRSKYRLKTYPLEAQLAWATRMGQEYGLTAKDRAPGKKGSLEDYYRASTSIETLRTLKALAIKEKLVDADLTLCCERLEEWVRTKQHTSLAPDYIERKAKREPDPQKRQRLIERAKRVRELKLESESDIEGYHKGQGGGSARGGGQTETRLSQIEKHGFFVSSCGGHTYFTSDLMRALGIAPLRFNVVGSREDLVDQVDHVWPARYDPPRNLWLSYQKGRHGRQWWYFNLPRDPVFSYAAEARRFPRSRMNKGPRPFPLVFCRELQGCQVEKLSHIGIPTKEVREWMLTPGF